jgi:hypothetical protein
MTPQVGFPLAVPAHQNPATSDSCGPHTIDLMESADSALAQVLAFEGSALH